MAGSTFPDFQQQHNIPNDYLLKLTAPLPGGFFLFFFKKHLTNILF
jgi:hypothetical protein